MGVVVAKYHFVWVSVGFPENSHDSMILQSTQIWKDINNKEITPLVSKSIDNVEFGPLIVANSAFPFTNWMMKPHTSSTRTVKQRNFNYRLSRARIVTEGA